MQKFIVLLMLLMATSSFAGEKKWYGVFTTDTYPVDGCKIVKAKEMVSFSKNGRAVEKVDEQDEKSYHVYIEKYYKSSREALISYAKTKGFNAIVGFQTVADTAIDMYDSGGSINGGYGYGYFRIESRGVPVLIKCK